MYTQCPDCATVFRVTAEALRVAQGDVRCGVCSTTFNALENLSEQAFRAAPAGSAPSPDDSMTVEELPGGENIELSAPVELAVVPDAPDAGEEEDRTEEETEPEPEPEPETDSESEPESGSGSGPEPDDEPDDESEAEPEPGPEPASAREADDEERAMEFHGDAAELDRLFVVEDPSVEHFDPATAAEALRQAEPEVDLDSTDEHPILVLDERDEPSEEPRAESIVLETPEPFEAAPPLPQQPTPPAATRPGASGHTAPRILIPDEMRRRLAEEAAARAEAAALFEPDADESPAFLSQRWPWVAGVSVLAILLLLQVLHSQRNDLVRSESLGPAIAGVYAFLGLSVLAPTDLSAYELRQWGAASDPNEANRLLLRASIVNRAGFAQPMPLLRLSLQDRFGGTLHVRDIAPADYLPGSGAGGLLAAGERADALIRIVDPGSDVVGFELDVCLPARGGVRCANQVRTAGP